MSVHSYIYVHQMNVWDKHYLKTGVCVLLSWTINPAYEDTEVIFLLIFDCHVLFIID